MQVLVRDNNVDQALRALKKKLQREGVFREMKLKQHYEKPSEKKAREKAEIKRLGKTCRSVWKETRTEEAVSAGYMDQLERRMPDVYAVHPEYRQDKSRLCGAAIPSFDLQMRRAGKLEARLQAPFSVYIHGDFNVDNVIYDPLDKRINFIDLHRSDYMDYVQDVSVFMVSNYRLHVLDRPLRRRIHEVAREFCATARRFARKSGDTTFEIRLALALAKVAVEEVAAAEKKRGRPWKGMPTLLLAHPPGELCRSACNAIQRQLDAKRKMIESGKDLDWATAEDKWGHRNVVVLLLPHGYGGEEIGRALCRERV